MLARVLCYRSNKVMAALLGNRNLINLHVITGQRLIGILTSDPCNPSPDQNLKTKTTELMTKTKTQKSRPD